MKDKLEVTLKRVAEKLNEKNIIWGVGASVMLKHYGIVDKCNDIDIQVSLDDIKKVDMILSEMGEKTKRLPDATYKTKFFYEYNIDGVDVDVMAGLCVHKNGKDYSFDFTKESTGEIMKIGDVDVPLAKLDNWYEIYNVLPGREKKAESIRKFLLK